MEENLENNLDETQEEIQEEDTRGQWFIINALSGHENKVKGAIERELNAFRDIKVYEILVPMEEVSEIRQGEKKTFKRKYYPGYIFLRMDLYDQDTGKLNVDEWHFIQDIDGVIQFVGNSSRPIPLLAQEVEDLMVQISPVDKSKPKHKIEFNVGETVKIKDGAFENFEGLIESIDLEKGRLKLLVSIFGRSTPVELEFWQVGRDE